LPEPPNKTQIPPVENLISKKEVEEILRIIIGIFLIAHGLIHWVLIAPHPTVPDARTGSFLTNSWLVGNLGLNEAVARWLGSTLIILATIGFAAAGIGVLGSQEWWRMLAVASAAVSIILIVSFWHNWFVVGPLLDTAIVVALLWLHWPPADVIGS
jgi:hypothetical protein